MSARGQGTELSAVRGNKRTHAQLSVIRESISRSTEDFVDLLDADGLLDDSDSDSDSETEINYTAAVHSRSVVLRTDQPVNVPGLLEMNQILEAERLFLQQAQEEILQDLFRSKDVRMQPDRTPAADEHLLIFKGVVQGVQSTVDRIHHSTGKTALNFSSAFANHITRHAERLLNDVFEHCKFPNDAELMMLTEASGLPGVGAVKQWFSRKRKESEDWAAAKALVHERLIQPDGLTRRPETDQYSRAFMGT